MDAPGTTETNPQFPYSQDPRTIRRRNKPFLGRAGGKWKVVRGGAEWRERSSRLDVGRAADSVLSSLGVELYERILRAMISCPVDNPLVIGASEMRILLPLALTCRAHYALFRRSVNGLYILPRYRAPLRGEIGYNRFVNAIFGLSRLSVLKLCGALEQPAATLLAIARFTPLLESLYIARCSNLTGEALRPLMGCKRLARIYFSSCNSLRDDAARFLAKVPRLRHLQVVASSRTYDVFVEGIAQAQQLESLDLYQCGGDRGVLALTQSETMRHGLQHLSLKRCRYITDVGVIAIGREMGQLKTLVLNFTHRITDESIAALANGPVANSLEKLEIYGCPRLTNDAANSITMLNCLKRFSFSGSTFGDGFVKVICKGCPLLEELGICGNSTALTDNEIGYIAQLPKLHALTLKYCRLQSDDAVNLLAEAANAQQLCVDIFMCNGVSQLAWSRLRSMCENVDLNV